MAVRSLPIAPMSQREILTVTGMVQGVGFRPFVYRIAVELGLRGSVCNTNEGVRIDIEGPSKAIAEFARRLRTELPLQAHIDAVVRRVADLVGYSGFQVMPSDLSGSAQAPILPDLAICDDCLRELFDPADRRYRYPFINCTNCGPRYSIVTGVPYDRERTTMSAFTMCPDCQGEYDDPANRRFHAQPNACSRCGPHVALLSPDGERLASRDEAILAACAALRGGQIVAVKGIGGYHLMVDAANDEAVRRLRGRKLRDAKPLALLYPSLTALRRDVEVGSAEEALLTSVARPIVLLRRRPDAVIAPSVAPRNPYLGAMLPYAPLHHLLMHVLEFPVVATSGNRKEEPICSDDDDALSRLRDIADLFLVHNRPIARFIDDSVVRVAAGETMVIRRSRGFVPAPVAVDVDATGILGVGGHQKNTAALGRGHFVYLSRHVGDLATLSADRAQAETIEDLTKMLAVDVGRVACDRHPDYRSTRRAIELSHAPVAVQHHYAHILSAMAENHLDGEVLGISWDGTGLGTDGTIWGGEFLRATRTTFGRVAHLRTFRLPGGERAIALPRRAALGLLHEMFGNELWRHELLPTVAETPPRERALITDMLNRKVASPLTSSAGRLFDAISSILGICQVADFDGQAAMELEFAADGATDSEPYAFNLTECDGVQILDWAPMVEHIIADISRRRSAGSISSRFHATMVEMMLAVTRRVGMREVVLSGGCFQNRRLLEGAIKRLKESGCNVYWQRAVPPNDGGLALGQVLAAACQKRG